MWISKKKWEAMEKRVADLEGQAQSQHGINIDVAAPLISHQIEELLKESNKQDLYKN